ncbi:MAG: hypothetical protein ACYDHW_12220 [Syntrophorhabdaceae bacterium]
MKISFVVPTGDVVNERRDRFLTRFMGACWHESAGKSIKIFGLKGYICTRCHMFFSVRNDFSTPEDFIKLFQWAKNEPGLEEFIARFKPKDFMNEKHGSRARKQFADDLYKILSAGGKEDV